MAKCFLYADQESSCSAATEKFDAPAVKRTRKFPIVNYERQGAARELERVGGLSRDELVRQFRRRCGTSPYHYSVMRRLDRSRRLIGQSAGLAATAADCGFADQAHFSRTFKAVYGITPGQYCDALCFAVDRNA